MFNARCHVLSAWFQHTHTYNTAVHQSAHLVLPPHTQTILVLVHMSDQAYIPWHAAEVEGCGFRYEREVKVEGLTETYIMLFTKAIVKWWNWNISQQCPRGELQVSMSALIWFWIIIFTQWNFWSFWSQTLAPQVPCWSIAYYIIYMYKVSS